MKKLKIGLQLFSVRREAEKDFEGTLKAVKKQGYDGVEPAGLYGFSGSEVRRMLDDAGLAAPCAHVQFSELLSDAAAVAETYKIIGCRYLAVPGVGGERLPGNPRYEDLKRELAAASAECRKRGITLLYHNHDEEFARVGGRRAIDIMLEDIPSDVIGFEPDVCWVAVGGGDPVEYIKKYASRTPVIHMQDYSMPENRRENLGFCPVGRGVQNVPAIIDAANFAATEWLIVEADEPPAGMSALECAALSAEYLKKHLG